MASNMIQDGGVLTLTAPAGGVVSGGLYVIGNLIVIAAFDAAAGEEFAGVRGGVWELPKVAADVAAEGDPAYFDGSAITIAATGNTLVGAFAKSAANGDALCEVVLKEMV